MPFTLTRFSRLRPYLYHLTARENVERILASRTIDTTESLLRQLGLDEWVGRHRTEHLVVKLGAHEHVVIRDQRPLKVGHLREGHEVDAVVRMLNARVYFWPGREDGPSKQGQNHFRRYAAEEPLVLRVATEELLAHSGNPDPEFCRFNSGAPRSHPLAGKAQRDPSIFVAASNADFTAGRVVEVTFPGRVNLPADVELMPVGELSID